MDVVVVVNSDRIKFAEDEANGWNVSDGLLTVVKDGKKVATFSTWIFVRFAQPQRVQMNANNLIARETEKARDETLKKAGIPIS